MSSSLMDRRESLDITMLNSDRSTTSRTTDEIVKDPRKDGAYREQSMINNARVLVFVVLVIATFAVATGCYIFTSEQERSEFENEFSAKASELVNVAGERADLMLDSVENMAVMAMSSADESSSWPYTIVKDWSAKAATIQKLIRVSNAIFGIVHVVENSQLETFSDFMRTQAQNLFEDAVEQGVTNNSVEELVSSTIPYPWRLGSDLRPYPSSSKNVTSLVAAEVFPLEISPLGTTYVNFDLDDSSEVRSLFRIVDATRRPALSFFEALDPVEQKFNIESQIMYPIYQSNRPQDKAGKVVGLSFLLLRWTNFVQSLLSSDYSNTVVVLESECSSDGQDKLVISFKIHENEKVESFAGKDEHDPRYNALIQSIHLVDRNIGPSQVPEGLCVPKVTFSVYPTFEFEESFRSSRPIIMTTIVVAIFAFTSLTFLIYDHFVRERRKQYIKRLRQQETIVSDLFPTAIRDRLYGGISDSSRHSAVLKSGDYDPDSPPLADLFLNTTVIFADIVGFTAWSSAREPEQVFILLETIYAAFDALAFRYNVFKVETVGDCYVAVVGLPEPQEEHALIACRFAYKCVKKMKELTEKLEVTLGPDTADLDIRVGIHSGQVTAGVLRGERSRFQLFGDTMNTAARMESSGDRGRVHLSEVTARILITKGLTSMIEARPQKLFIKGKGMMQTYWFNASSVKSEVVKPEDEAKFEKDRIVRFSDETAETDGSSEDLNEDDDIELDAAPAGGPMTKTERLVEWNVKILSSLLQQIIASRGGEVKDIEHLADIEHKLGVGKMTVLDEFKPIIPLKRFETEDLITRRNPNSIVIGQKALDELRSFVSNVSMLYQDNPFHNFEHASHVTASVKKLLKRIVTVDESEVNKSSQNRDVKLEDMVGHSYGITSDPLTQFAVVFSAVIHDVDHPGVPNAQLLKEQTRSARIYGKSIAEQNSVDLTWELFMSEQFRTFRACIYQTEEEFRRFRQLVVNTVMATDIADKELQSLRKDRWNTAFSESPLMESLRESEDRKATIVIEHLIQASDVSHTMQHWHIYKSWNEKFFMECYGAFRNGRAENDPSIGWYKGEIGFFDFYVIPLAKKLDNCGVFGVSSHEYLSYANANRDEWEREGETIIQEFLEKYEREYGGKQTPKEEEDL